MRNIKPLFYLYQVYKYVIVFPIFGISTCFFGSTAVILSIIFGSKAGTIMGVLWAKSNSYITPMFVKVYGKENIDKNQSYVVISNHQSQYDIFVIYGWLPVDFRWVMKIELRKVPFLGYACHVIGHVFIDRSNPIAAINSLKSAKDKIKGGTSIMFFPEGTRSDNGKLKIFKKGAFKTALDMNLPILPISIIGTKEIVPNNSIAVFPGSAKLVINEPIDTSGYSEKNIDELILKGRAAIQKGLDEYSRPN